jgi:hypothetical protein
MWEIPEKSFSFRAAKIREYSQLARGNLNKKASKQLAKGQQ